MSSTYGWLTCACILLAVLALCFPAGAAEEGPASEAEKPASDSKAEWISLFNGKDLTGWQNARNPKAENKWLVEDGCLTNKSHANNIATVVQFKDLALKLEYKIVPHGNSGTYLRGRVEIQILDSHGKKELAHGDDGGIYGLFPPKVNASKPVGEWNQLEAVYRGDTLTVKLNGKVVQDAVKIATVTGGALPGGVNEPGPIMLQGDHGKIWFRNIMIKPFRENS